MKKMNLLLNYLETNANNYSKINSTVSDSSVGWHIIHCCLVINSVIYSVVKSDPKSFKKKFSFKAFMVLLLNKFPRGRAKAPSFTMPNEDINTDVVFQNINESRKKLELLLAANENQYFTHPIFGDLNLKPTIKFLGVHTNHHIKIIKDTLK
ncbi:MAG: hypothetical protein WCJ68_07915 [Chitinophagia bacterium]